MKILSIVISAVCYGLIMGSFFYSLKLAKKEHHVGLKDVKNEIPNGYLIRAVCSLVYYFCIIDWMIGSVFLKWAYIPYNSAVNISGLILLVLVTVFFWQISVTLGSNYHGPLKLHENHRLVTTGPYRFIRHPAYAAFPLFHTALFLITGNYILLASGWIMSIYTNHNRIKTEEKLLTERFGKEYEEYRKRAGMYFPVLFKNWRNSVR